MYYGDVLAGATIRFPFNTVGSTGAPTAMAGSPALAVHKDDDAAQSTAGITLNESFDSRTGLALVEIDTSADAFYTTGHDYFVILTAGTVDGVTVVGTVVGCFSIENRPVNAVQFAGETVALSSGNVPADIKAINGTTVNGTGAAGDVWRSA